jgi:adenosine kinase
MVQYAEECRALGIRYIFDPGQQCARMSGDELRAGALGATAVICNDYEFELLRQKSGLGEDEILVRSEVLIVTRGEHGCSVIAREGRTDVPAVATRRVVDPTGVGDAFRGGLLKGIALGLPYAACAQIGSVAATYALEHLGGQSHAYSWSEFKQRYEEHFGHLNVPSLKSQG